MANFEIKFFDALDHPNTYITCKQKEQGYEDLISIHINDFGKDTEIWLDKSTAIKLAKALRTEINKIQ